MNIIEVTDAEVIDVKPAYPATQNGGMPATYHPEHLAGRNAGAATLTSAQSDEALCNEWLSFYSGRARTFESYQRESQRLLDWCKETGKPFQSMMVGDVQAYYSFLQDPQPATRWCVQPEPRVLADGTPNPKWKSLGTPRKFLPDGSPNPLWKPFTNGGLSVAAADQAMLVLGGLFEYAASVGYLSHNPIKIFKKRNKSDKAATLPDEEIDRYLEPAVWQAALDGIETMAQDGPRELAHYHRAKFLILFLYFTGLRREEMSKARTEHLKLKRGKWGLMVQGKGKKTRRVPLPEGAVAAIQEYRAAMGRTPWPAPTDPSEPLIMDIYAAGRPLSGKSVYEIVTAVFERAADNEPDPHKAQVLLDASTHWLRHTCASRMLESQVPLKTVQKFLGHASIATTSRYLHTDWDTMHDEVQKHTR